MKYFVIPDSRDDCSLPTTPEPMPLEQVSAHIAIWKDRYHQQGYYSNCNHEHLALDEMTFHLVPEDGYEDVGQFGEGGAS